jgi:N utilization substance protein A
MANTNTPRTEFSSALAQLAKERNLDPEIIVDSVRQAILAAFKKDYPDGYSEDAVYEVQINGASGEAVILLDKKNITPPGFGRIAAQTARQVVYQKIREAEKSASIAEYEKRVGSLVNGLIIRFINGEIIVDIGRAEAVMPSSEQIHSEDYHMNQKMVFYIEGIRDSSRGKEIVVSRAHPKLIAELFKREVPEVSSGAVEIKGIARDAGSRTKIAVYSSQSGIDAVGSCVGQKGVRVQAVMREVTDKIDIVPFNEDQAKYVASALAPAADLVVKIDSVKKTAIVMAPESQLSLAIGREGQNAKLAGKLTDLYIDIQPLKE